MLDRRAWGEQERGTRLLLCDSAMLAAGRRFSGLPPLPLIGTLVLEFYNRDVPGHRRHVVLLLVPVRLDPGQRGMHLHRVPRHPEAGMTSPFNRLEFGIVVAIFVIILLGFAAVRWKRAPPLACIDGWVSPAAGSVPGVTWFLLGGDLYAAYTFVR